jgi:chromosome segregation ATPase
MEGIRDPVELYRIINKQQETIEQQNRQINEQRIRIETMKGKNEELDEEADNLMKEITRAHDQTMQILKIEKKEEAIANQLRKGLDTIEELFEKITHYIPPNEEKETLELQIKQIMIRLEKLEEMETLETEADTKTGTNEWKDKYEDLEQTIEKIIKELEVDSKKGAQDIVDFEKRIKEFEERKRAKRATKSINRTGSEPSSSKNK